VVDRRVFLFFIENVSANGKIFNLMVMRSSVRTIKIVNSFLLLLITACASPPNRHIDTPEPSHWIANNAVSTKITTQWLNEFADARLTDLVHEALAHNYDLKAAALRVNAAREQAKIAGAERLPHINLSPNYHNERDSQNGTKYKMLLECRLCLQVQAELALQHYISTTP
jgi:hypothetical protein